MLQEVATSPPIDLPKQLHTLTNQTQLQIQSKRDLDQKQSPQKQIKQLSKISMGNLQSIDNNSHLEIIQHINLDHQHDNQFHNTINKKQLQENQNHQQQNHKQLPTNTNNYLEHHIKQQKQPTQDNHPSYQLQILNKKQLTNCQFIKNQIKQTLKIINLMLLLQQQKSIKYKICQINSEIKKIKIKSNSNHKIDQIKSSKNISKIKKITELQHELKKNKSISNRLNTRLLQLQNYILITTNKQTTPHPHKPTPTIQTQPNNFPEEEQQDNYQINKFRSITASQKNIKDNFIYPKKNKISIIQPSKTVINAKFQKYNPHKYIDILKQHHQILKNTIQNTKSFIKVKQYQLQKQKNNLQQQIEIIKTHVLELDTYNRKIRSFSNKTNRKINSLQQHYKYRKQLRYLASSRSQNKLISITPIKSLSLTSKTIGNKISNNKLPTPKQSGVKSSSSYNGVSLSNSQRICPRSESFINILTKQCQKQVQPESMNCQIQKQYYQQSNVHE